LKKSFFWEKPFSSVKRFFPDPFPKYASRFAQMQSMTAFEQIAKAFRKGVCPDQSGLALEKGFSQKKHLLKMVLQSAL